MDEWTNGLVFSMSRSRRLCSTTDTDADRRADETEVLAELVDEIAFVGKVELGGYVREEHEPWRRARRLRGIQDADRAAVLARGRIRHRDLLDELVQR